MTFSLNQNFTDTDAVRNRKTAVTHEERNIKGREGKSESVGVCVRLYVYLCGSACLLPLAVVCKKLFA